MENGPLANDLAVKHLQFNQAVSTNITSIFHDTITPSIFADDTTMTSNNVLLAKKEGPVWHTIYHHLPAVSKQV